MELPSMVGCGRCIGVIGNFVLCVCLFISMVSDQWLLYDEGRTGLWKFCTKNMSSPADENSDDCSSIEMGLVKSYLQATRALLILSVIVHAVFILGPNHICNLTEQTIEQTRFGFLFNFLAVLFGWFAIWSYGEYAVDKCDYTNCRLGNHYYIALCANYLSLPITLLLAMPWLWVKFQDSLCHKKLQDHFGCCRSGNVSGTVPTEARAPNTPNPRQTESQATGYVLNPATLEQRHETSKRSGASATAPFEPSSNPPFDYNLPGYSVGDVATNSAAGIPPVQPPSYLSVVTNREHSLPPPPPYVEVEGTGDVSGSEASVSYIAVRESHSSTTSDGT